MIGHESQYQDFSNRLLALAPLIHLLDFVVDDMDYYNVVDDTMAVVYDDKIGGRGG